LKKFFRSQKDMPGKTKADIVKQIWALLHSHLTSVPSLICRQLAEFSIPLPKSLFCQPLQVTSHLDESIRMEPSEPMARTV